MNRTTEHLSSATKNAHTSALAKAIKDGFLMYCYNCDMVVSMLAPDGRCFLCTRYTPRPTNVTPLHQPYLKKKGEVSR